MNKDAFYKELKALQLTERPAPVMIDRVSINGCRYIATTERGALEDICDKKGIPQAWIRWHAASGQWYLRLWGRWKGV